MSALFYFLARAVMFLLARPKKYVFLALVRATLTELRRDTSKVIRPVIHAAKSVVLTEHGQEVAEIVPKARPDRARAIELLTAIGPVRLPARR